jgi:hypothetical protein
MKYKRSFIFIRPNEQSMFYTETTDFVNQLRKIIPNNIDITLSYQEQNIVCISFWFPELSDYDWFTENLYIQGELKNIFKSAMIYAKTNQHAFCLPSINLQNFPTDFITRYWYYNIKQPMEKFYDATPGQKQALKLLSGIMHLSESVHSITIFDYDHNVKFTENAVVGTVSTKDFQKILLDLKRKKFNDYVSSKRTFNHEHNVVNSSDIGQVHRNGVKFNVQPISYFLPDSLKNFTLDLTL